MIVNLTQHAATPDQLAAGVFDLEGAQHAALVEALTFRTLPSREDIQARAEGIADLALLAGDDDVDAPTRAMIGGALWLMGPLAEALRERGIVPLFAYSEREVSEEVQPDGSVRKVVTFRHSGWVAA